MNNKQNGISHIFAKEYKVSFSIKKIYAIENKERNYSAKKVTQLDLRENPILSCPMFRELDGKHNWKEDNPEHVSLSFEEVLKDYYSRSIIQFHVKRNDRGSRKRTSPEIRTRKRTKGIP